VSRRSLFLCIFQTFFPPSRPPSLLTYLLFREGGLAHTRVAGGEEGACVGVWVKNPPLPPSLPPSLLTLFMNEDLPTFG